MDFARYADLAPANIRYDAVERTYIPTETFDLKFYRISPERLLLQYQALVNQLIEKSDTFIGILPSLGVVPSPNRGVNPVSLRKIITAIQANHAIHISYQSLSSPEPTNRWIAPHAMAFDGYRWHARAWCEQREEFRDFVLARIRTVRSAKPSVILASDDLEWTTAFTLKLVPHSKLSASHKSAIELDYGMQDGVLHFETTLHLAWYLTHRLMLDVDPDKLPAERLQLELLNREELLAAQRNAKVRSVEMVKRASSSPD